MMCVAIVTSVEITLPTVSRETERVAPRRPRQAGVPCRAAAPTLARQIRDGTRRWARCGTAWRPSGSARSKPALSNNLRASPRLA